MAPIGQRTSYAILPKTRKTTNAATGTVAPSRIAVADRPLLRFLIGILHPAMREEIRLVVNLFPAISAKHDQTLSGGTDGPANHSQDCHHDQRKEKSCQKERADAQKSEYPVPTAPCRPRTVLLPAYHQTQSDQRKKETEEAPPGRVGVFCDRLLPFVENIAAGRTNICRFRHFTAAVFTKHQTPPRTISRMSEMRKDTAISPIRMRSERNAY